MIGKVVSVALRDDRKSVGVVVQLDRSAASFAVEDTTFWVVRPRIGTGGVSGLGTLLSGAYIGTDAGVSTKSRSEFIGLEAPPFVLRGEPGTIFVLRSDDLGSLDVGSPVFHRRTPVGRVVGYTLDAERDELSLKIFVEAPYQKLVTLNSRFWNASGIDLTLNASGLSVNTQTLASVLAGGMAFDAPPDAARAAQAPENTVFTLFADRRSALAPADGVAGAGADDLRPVGARPDAGRRRSTCSASTSAASAASRSSTTRSASASRSRSWPRSIRCGSARCARRCCATPAARATPSSCSSSSPAACARSCAPATCSPASSTSRSTSSPGRRARASIGGDGAVRMPTAPGTLSELQPQIAEIVQKVSKIPFDDIGRDLRTTLRSANAAIGQLTPEAQKALAEVQRTLSSAQKTLENLDRNVTDPSSPVQRNLEDTLQELQRTARALRLLSDYLQQHPEALLRGKPADAPVPNR